MQGWINDNTFGISEILMASSMNLLSCTTSVSLSHFTIVYTVFKQTASHLPHEANSEQLFSRSGDLSDDNGKMDPVRLGVWTSIGVNYSTFQPSVQQIMERYMLKFSKGGTAKLHDDDLGLLDPDGNDDTSGDACYFVQDVQASPSGEAQPQAAGSST